MSNEAIQDTSQMTEDEITYCAKHPTRETSLRCNKCDRLMCVQCAVQTPVGYRCQECIRAHDSKFFNATVLDYAIGLGVTVLTMLALTFLVVDLSTRPMRFLAIVFGFLAGRVSRYITRRLTQRRRAQYMHFVGVAGVAVSYGLGFMLFGERAMLNLIVIGFTALAAFTVYYQYRIVNNV